jgi:hypothetical protein
LNKYLSYNEGSPFTTFIDAIAPSDYKKNDKVETAMKNFTDKYEKLAVSVSGDGNIKKVPGKNIYFVYKDFDISGGTFDKAFTIIQKGDHKVTIN